MRSLPAHAKRQLAVAITTIMALTLIGCGTPPDASPSTQASSPASRPTNAPTVTKSRPDSIASYSGTSYPLTVKDWAGNVTTFNQRPQRVILVTGTAFNVWYDAGGTAVATSNRTENIKMLPEVAKALEPVPQLGKASALDQEGLMAMNPDLVITSANADNAQAEKLSTNLRNAGINVVNMSLRTKDDVYMAYEIFGAINGNSEKALQKVQQLESQVAQITSKFPANEHKKIVILYVTSQALTVKLNNSIAGEMAQALGLKNVVSGRTGDAQNSENFPLDIEFLTQNQPDIVLVTSKFPSNDEAKSRLEANFANNSAWQAIDAIREGRVHYLPQQYFLYNAGPYYPDALEYLAACVHPEIYGSPKAP